MANDTNVIYRPKSKIEKEHITIHGCGKYGDEKTVLNKAEASLLFLELYKFLNQK